MPVETGLNVDFEVLATTVLNINFSYFLYQFTVDLILTYRFMVPHISVIYVAYRPL